MMSDSLIELIRIKEEDLDELFWARNDPEIMQWCRQYAPLHWENHKDWYKWQANDQNTEMAIIKRIDGINVGVCGLTSIDYIARRAEFSCYIYPCEQGKGYATSALKALFDFGFEDLNLNLIWGETFEGNPAYKLFTEKLGMKHEGTRRQFYFKNGKYVDAHLISITRDEWNQKS